MNNHRRSMTEEELAVYRNLRGLENYRMHFINKKCPVLSFVYALYGGGEHTLYCDFSADHVYAYLLRDLPGMTRELFDSGDEAFMRKLPEYMRELFRLLKDLYIRSNGRMTSVEPTPEDFEVVLKAIRHELLGANKPVPVW